MDNVRIVEDGQVSGTRITNDGYLVAEVRCARTGIQDYMGYEFGRPEKKVFRVYRPEDEVFSTDSLRSFVGKPVTDNHPDEPVNSENWKKHAVGQIGNEVLRDGDFIRVPMTLMDEDVIAKVRDGKREISMGYEMQLEFEEGTTPDGQAYDAVMRGLRMNHLAIVDRGRAGPSVRIGDHWGATPTTNDGKPPMTLKTIVVDGLSVETTDAGAKAIEKLQKEVTAANDKVSAAQAATDTELAQKQAAHDAAIAEKDGELAAKDAQIAELKGQILSDADLDKRVADRASLVTKASTYNKDADFTGKTDTEIKAIAVDAVHGEGFSADKAPAYIDVAFDLLKAPEVKDSVREALKDRKPAEQVKDNGQAAYEARLNAAYKAGV